MAALIFLRSTHSIGSLYRKANSDSSVVIKACMGCSTNSCPIFMYTKVKLNRHFGGELSLPSLGRIDMQNLYGSRGSAVEVGIVMQKSSIVPARPTK